MYVFDSTFVLLYYYITIFPYSFYLILFIVHLLLLTSFFCLLVFSASKQQQLWVTSTIFIQLGTNRPEITELFSLGQGCGSGPFSVEAEA